MRYVFFFLSIALCGQSCTTKKWDRTVLDMCLNDLRNHSYYIALTIKTDTGRAHCVIRNRYLYQFYQEKYGMNLEQYKLTAKSLIIHNQTISVDKSDLEKFGFRLINIPGPITEELGKGKDFILDKYFHKVNGGFVANPTLPKEYEYEIIYALFNSQVLVASSDESGVLYTNEE